MRPGYECQDCGNRRKGDESLKTAESSGYAPCRGDCDGITFHTRPSASSDGVTVDDEVDVYECEDCGKTFYHHDALTSHVCYPDVDVDIDELWDRDAYTQPHRDPNVIHVLFVQMELPRRKIGEMLGCSASAVQRTLHRADIDYTLREDRPWTDADLLETLYHDRQMTTDQIADKLGCAPITVLKWMDEFDIETRTGWDAVHPGQTTEAGD